MRIATAAPIAVLALMLAGPVFAQEQTPSAAAQTVTQTSPPTAPAPAAPGIEPPPAATAAPPSAAAEASPPPAAAASPPLAPKIQDQALSKAAPLRAPQAADARFSFDKVSEGFVRLDVRTGQVAYCSARTVGWSCEAVPENRPALERQITRLQDEIADLKKEIAALTREIAELRAPAPPPIPPAPIPPPAAAPETPGGVTLKLPTQDDLARVRAYVGDKVQDTWRRLIEMVGEFQKDVMRKG